MEDIIVTLENVKDYSCDAIIRMKDYGGGQFIQF